MKNVSHDTVLWPVDEQNSRSRSSRIELAKNLFESFPVAARSKAWVYGRSPAAIVGSNPIRGMDVCLL